MATARKPAVDPLTEELPPEPRPSSAGDIRFEVQISPYVVSGTVFYRWAIVTNSHKDYVSDYTGHNNSGYRTADEAEDAAVEYVERIRQTVDLKLNVPDAYLISL